MKISAVFIAIKDVTIAPLLRVERLQLFMSVVVDEISSTIAMSWKSINSSDCLR